MKNNKLDVEKDKSNKRRRGNWRQGRWRKEWGDAGVASTEMIEGTDKGWKSFSLSDEDVLTSHATYPGFIA